MDCSKSKSKKCKKKHTEKQDFSEINNLVKNVSDGEVTVEKKRHLNDLARIRKGKKKRAKGDNILEIDDSETNKTDEEAISYRKLNLDDTFTLRLVENGGLKKKKKRRKKSSDGEAPNPKMSMSSQPLENSESWNEQANGTLEKDDINLTKRKKSKRKCNEREDRNDIDHSSWLFPSSSEGYFTKDVADDNTNLLPLELDESKEKDKNNGGKFCAISSFADTGEPSVEVMAVKCKVDAVRVSKKIKKSNSSDRNNKKKSSKENVEEINSIVDLQDGSSNLDETINKENGKNLSAFIESNASYSLRQEAETVDEVKNDIDGNMVTRSRKRNPKTKSSGNIDETNESTNSDDTYSFCESENDSSSSDSNPVLNCQTTLQSPSVKVSKKKSNNFACHMCNRVYNRKDNLTTHIKVKHECKPMFKCYTCSKSFQYKHVLQEHIAGVHGDDDDLLSCKLCSYKTKRSKDLKTHVMAMHEGLVFRCSECRQDFSCESNLRRHMKITHLNKKEFVCAYCGKFFTQAHNLKLHMKTHLEDKITCIVCEQEFENRQKLSMHLLGHAPKIGFNCPYCDYVLVSEKNDRMRRHIKEKHSKGEEDRV